MTFNILFSIQARFVMAFGIQALLFVGIIPALLLWFFALKGYEGLTKDKTLFLIFVIGILIGVVSAVARFFVYVYPLVILLIVIFAFFDQLFKTIVLNIGRLQRKKETAIYGLSLGLGFGASFTPFLILAGGISEQDTMFFLVLVFIGAIGYTLFHAATAAIIGFGVYKGKLVKYLLTAIILQLPFNAILDITRFTEDPIYPYSQIGLLVFGLAIYLYVILKIMPNLLKESDKRKRSKKTKV
jgi:hypothetical protein